MKLVYPAIFYPFENGSGYTVEVPDLPGCISEGDSLADAILMGTDAASGWILDELEDGNVLPEPSDISELQSETGTIVNILALDMDTYAEKFGSKSVRKNITIPAYMDTYVETHGLSLSKVMQEAISSYMVNRSMHKYSK